MGTNGTWWPAGGSAVWCLSPMLGCPVPLGQGNYKNPKNPKHPLADHSGNLFLLFMLRKLGEKIIFKKCGNTVNNRSSANSARNSPGGHGTFLVNVSPFLRGMYQIFSNLLHCKISLLELVSWVKFCVSLLYWNSVNFWVLTPSREWPDYSITLFPTSIPLSIPGMWDSSIEILEVLSTNGDLL